jgi:hypothetical protein
MFITFTCNPKWQEIADALKFVPGQRPDARPDIVSRVFRLKVDELVVYKESKPNDMGSSIKDNIMKLTAMWHDYSMRQYTG